MGGKFMKTKKIILSGMLLFFVVSPLYGSEIEEELKAYYNPSFLKETFYTQDRIVIGDRTFTRDDIENRKEIVVYRFPVAAHAPSQVDKNNRQKTGYTREEQRKEIIAKEKELQRSLTEQEKAQLLANFPLVNDLQADEAEAFCVLRQSIDNIEGTLLNLGKYHTFPLRLHYFQSSEEISETAIRVKNPPDVARQVITELQALRIFPTDPNHFYQSLLLKIQQPAMETVTHYHRANTDAQGKPLQETVVRNGRQVQVPTTKVFWKEDPRFKEDPAQGKMINMLYPYVGMSVNSGYVVLQPYVQVTGEIDYKRTAVTYHIYTKFDPTDNPANDVTRHALSTRERTTAAFIQDIANFLGSENIANFVRKQ